MLGVAQAQELLRQEKAKRVERFKEAVDVSAAMDNCFFHSLALHFLGNGKPFPAELFAENTLDAPAVRQLKQLLQEEASQRLLTTSATPDYLFEKTLILGVLLRSWFVQQLLQSKESREAIFSFPGEVSSEHDLRRGSFVQMVADYREAALADGKAPARRAVFLLEDVSKSLENAILGLLESDVVNEPLMLALGQAQEKMTTSIANLNELRAKLKFGNKTLAPSIEALNEAKKELEGVLNLLKDVKTEQARAIEKMLQEAQTSKLGYDLTAEEYSLASFFVQVEESSIYLANASFFDESLLSEEAEGESDTIGKYWEQKGFENYCKFLSNPSVKITYADVDSVLSKLCSYGIYNQQDGTVIVCDTKEPEMELALGAKAGHYILLSTPKTEGLFKEYTQQKEHYLTNREDLLALEAPTYPNTFFVEATFPKSHLKKDPVDTLVEVVPEFLKKLQPKKEETHGSSEQVKSTTTDVSPVEAHSPKQEQGMQPKEDNKLSPVESGGSTHVTIPKTTTGISPSGGDSKSSQGEDVKLREEREREAKLREEQEAKLREDQDAKLREEREREAKLREEREAKLREEKDKKLPEIKDSQLTNQKLKDFYKELTRLENKVSELELKSTKSPEKYQNAAVEARALHTKLHKAFATFLESPKNEASFTSFSNVSINAIHKHQGVLESHRKTWGLFKQVIGNILLGIAGLGIFYGFALAANYHSSGRYFFFGTKTAQQVSKIEKMIPDVEAPPEIKVK
ncbi:hypothetical protein [Legionella brunensis]|uniref:hypothetical protein n=1 Tax=Legionella brunensis TaxID=29422 RepID=UPI0010416AF1|nr:hypothetical protein [Legionella brunensis]